MATKNPATNNVEPQSISTMGRMYRKPQRVSITIPESVYDYLVQRSSNEGRSLSNLAAHILEVAAEQAGQ